MENDEELIFVNCREKLKPIYEELSGLEELKLEIIHDQVNYNV